MADDLERLLDSTAAAKALAAFIVIIRDDAGINDEEELCALAHHWLDKAMPDAGESEHDEATAHDTSADGAA